jgi:thiaminase
MKECLQLFVFVLIRRDNYTIGVLYIRCGRKSEKEIFSVEPSETTKEYHDFLSNLGWEVRFIELLIDWLTVAIEFFL